MAKEYVRTDLAASTPLGFNKSYTVETANVAAGVESATKAIDPKLLQFTETGGFFDLLKQQSFSLAVTREYEHFVLALDGDAGGAIQSPFPLPHPSGMWWDAASRELIVSSTRTPNIIFWMSPFTASSACDEIRPKDVELPHANESLFLPRKARYLPGSLYIHDLVKMGDDLYATITGHNFLAKLSIEAGFERVWHPKALDALGADAYDQNYFQLNSIAVNGTPENSFYTGFSDLTTGAKPWKGDYGPRGKGVVFSGRTREPLLRGLTCPHSAKLHDNKLWVCNSGYGSIGYVENYASHDLERTRYVEVAKVPGFSRGLAFAGDHMFVGLSKVIPAYEPYAPGLETGQTQCGIYVFDWRTGAQVASLSWPEGYQIYDVQILFGIKAPRMPSTSRPSDGINTALRFLA